MSDVYERRGGLAGLRERMADLSPEEFRQVAPYLPVVLTAGEYSGFYVAGVVLAPRALVDTIAAVEATKGAVSGDPSREASAVRVAADQEIRRLLPESIALAKDPAAVLPLVEWWGNEGDCMGCGRFRVFCTCEGEA